MSLIQLYYVYREEVIKQINDIISKKTDDLEKHMETLHNELISKNETELKNM